MVPYNIGIRASAWGSRSLDRVSLAYYGTGVAVLALSQAVEGLMLTLATPCYGFTDRPSSLMNSLLISTTISVS